MNVSCTRTAPHRGAERVQRGHGCSLHRSASLLRRDYRRIEEAVAEHECETFAHGCVPLHARHVGRPPRRCSGGILSNASESALAVARLTVRPSRYLAELHVGRGLLFVPKVWQYVVHVVSLCAREGRVETGPAKYPCHHSTYL